MIFHRINKVWDRLAQVDNTGNAAAVAVEITSKEGNGYKVHLMPLLVEIKVVP